MYSKCSDAQLADREERRRNINGRVRFPRCDVDQTFVCKSDRRSGSSKRKSKKDFLKRPAWEEKHNKDHSKTFDYQLAQLIYSCFDQPLQLFIVSIYLLGSWLSSAVHPHSLAHSLFTGSFWHFICVFFFYRCHEEKGKKQVKIFWLDCWTTVPFYQCLFRRVLLVLLVHQQCILIVCILQNEYSFSPENLREVSFLPFEMDTHKTKSIVDKTFQCRDGHSSSSLPTSPTNTHRQQWLPFGSEPLRVGFFFFFFGAFLLALISGGGDWTALTFRVQIY